jgi:UDP-glucose 4-epimerase
MSNKALVTGGAGFIGSHVVARLLQDGWQVRVLDDLSSGDRAKLPAGDIEFIEGDIRDPQTCKTACTGCDAVFHLAALVSVVGSVENPSLNHDINITGTLNMMTAARDANVRRFVFSSSAAVYGDAEQVPTEETQPLKPQSPYAVSKACGEMYGKNFHDLYGLEVVSLRYFNVFGPRQNVTSGYAAVIPAFVKAALSGRQPIVYGDGLQTRDFVFVENVADANLKAATASGVAGHVFNVAGGVQTSLLDLIAALELATGKKLEPRFEPARSGEVRHSRAAIELARNVLGFVPTVGLEDGLGRTVEGTVAWEMHRAA